MNFGELKIFILTIEIVKINIFNSPNLQIFYVDTSLRAQENVRGMARLQQQHSVAKMCCNNLRRSGDGRQTSHLIGRSQPLTSQDIKLKNSPMQKNFS